MDRSIALHNAFCVVRITCAITLHLSSPAKPRESYGSTPLQWRVSATAGLLRVL